MGTWLVVGEFYTGTGPWLGSGMIAYYVDRTKVDARNS